MPHGGRVLNMYQSLSGLLEMVASWALEISQMIDLRDFSIHASADASSQALGLVSSMAVLGLLHIVSGLTHQVGHILDLILGSRMSSVII